ncbi:MAG: regulatory protein RecX [Chitinophagaceae bacterium]
MLYRKQFTKEQALQKIKQFCAYQERCHYEVKEKLYAYGIHKQQVEELIAQLIEEDYLNEERFAIQFAGGRFRMKQWGRIKIAYELKQKQVSTYCIKTALKQIDETDYIKTLCKLVEKKWNSIEKEESNKFSRINKTTEYLLQKGYEAALIKEEITTLEKVKAQRQ